MIIRELSHLPVVVDPSHDTGRTPLISPMSLAAIAAGAEGLIVEVHNKPVEALCDGDPSLAPAKFSEMMALVRTLVTLMESLP